MTETSLFTVEEKREALDRALGSRIFARSDQLKSFLRFVCNKEMMGRSAELTEYVIGVEVLGRPEGYSTAEDSSVRTRAYELRQKLQKLYSTELPNEPVQIVIAKGAYSPQFVKCTAEGSQMVPVAPVPQEQPAETARPGNVWRRIVMRAAALLLASVVGAAIAVVYLRQNAAKAGPDPVLEEAWRPMSGTDANAVLAVAAPLHLIVGPKGHISHGLRVYPPPPETLELYQRHRPPLSGGALEMTFTDNAVGFGTMNAVVSTVNTLKLLGSTYQILPDRAAPISALRGRNVVLFGNPPESQTIYRSVEPVPLIVDFEPSVKSFVVRDRASGRIFVPKPDGKGGFSDVYGLVTVLNTRNSDRGHLGMVIFSGVNSAGTDGAAQFFTSPRSLRDLRATFAREGINGFPAAYQVVVKCTFGDLLMFAYEYSAHKVLQK